MLGRKELASLETQKQVLLLESGLNRLTLQAEFRSLRSATAWVSDVASASRELAPFLMVLAPIAGFLFARGTADEAPGSAGDGVRQMGRPGLSLVEECLCAPWRAGNRESRRLTPAAGRGYVGKW